MMNSFADDEILGDGNMAVNISSEVQKLLYYANRKEINNTRGYNIYKKQTYRNFIFRRN